MTAATIIMLSLKISLFLTALGFGLNATLTDLWYLLRQPGQLLRSVLAMNMIMPLVAMFMAFLFGLPPLVKVTLLAISVSPLAPLFPKNTLKAGGHEGYVIGLMVVASVLSILLIPLTLEILAHLLHKSIAIDLKALIITAFLSVIMPLILGIFLRRFASTFAEKIAGPVSGISRILLIVSVLPVLVKMFPAVMHLAGNGTIVAIATFVFAGILVGHLLGGPARTDSAVLAMATASRHPAIALLVASSNMQNHNLAPAAILLYLLINAAAALFYLKWLQGNKQV